MAEFTASAEQTINPGETAVFTENPVPCRRGFVRHRDETANFLLSGWTPRKSCGCCANSAIYQVAFSADIALPEGGTPGEITVALTIDGATIPASTMTQIPAAAEEYANVAKVITAEVWRGCCETITVRNTSSVPILMRNASINFSRPDLTMSY